MAKSVRRSSRARVHQDYAAMEGVGLDLSDEEELGRKEKRFRGRKVRQLDAEAMFRELTTREDFDAIEPVVMAPEEVTADWLRADGLKKPVLVHAAPHAVKKMGMKIPSAESLSASKVAAKMGLSHAVPTMDVNSQSEGPRMTMREWAEYWSAPRGKRKQLLNVLSLSLAGTPLEPAVRAPAAVEAVDLVAAAWPVDVQPRPMVQLYMLMSVEGCYTDFHLDFGGSSVWYHMVSGRKVFLLAPPTPANLAAFVDWASSKKQSAFFGDMATGLQRIEINAGDTLLLPGGWPHAVATPEASIALGGNFLHGGNLPLQLEVHRIEDRLGVAKKFRFPLYKQLMWRTAQRYTSLLRAQLPDAQEQPLKLNSSSEGSSEMPGGKPTASASTGFTASHFKKAAADAPSAALAGPEPSRHTTSKPISIPSSHAGRAAGATDDAGGSKFRLKIRKPAPGLAGTPPTIPADSARQATKAAHEAARDVCKQGSKRKAAGVVEEQEVEQPMCPTHRPPGRRSSHEYYPEMSTGSANNSAGSPYHNPAYYDRSAPLGSSPATGGGGGGSQIIEFLGPWKQRPAGSAVTASSGGRPALGSGGGVLGAPASLGAGTKPLAYTPTHSANLPPCKREGGAAATHCGTEVLSPRLSSPAPAARVPSELHLGPGPGAPAAHTSARPPTCAHSVPLPPQPSSEMPPPPSSAPSRSRSPGHGFDPGATAGSKCASPVGHTSDALGEAGEEEKAAGSDPREDRWRCALSVLRTAHGEERVKVVAAWCDESGECAGAPELHQEKLEAGLESRHEGPSDGREREVRSDGPKLPDDLTASQPAGSGTSARSGPRLTPRAHEQDPHDLEDGVESKVKLEDDQVAKETRSAGEEDDTDRAQRGALATAGPAANRLSSRVATETARDANTDASPAPLGGPLSTSAAPSAHPFGGSLVPEERRMTAVRRLERTSELEEEEQDEEEPEEPHLISNPGGASPATSFAMPPPRPPRWRKEEARAHSAGEATLDDGASWQPRPAGALLESPARGRSPSNEGRGEKRGEGDRGDEGATPGRGRVPATPVAPTRPAADEAEEVCSPPEKQGATQGQQKEEVEEGRQGGARDGVDQRTPDAIPAVTAEAEEAKGETVGVLRDANLGAQAEVSDVMDLDGEPKEEALPGAECAGEEGTAEARLSIRAAAPATGQSSGAAEPIAAGAAVGGKEAGAGGEQGGATLAGEPAPTVKLRVSLRNALRAPSPAPPSPSSPAGKAPAVRRRVVLKLGGSSMQAGGCLPTPQEPGRRKLRITGAFASNQEVATPRAAEGWGEAAASPASSTISDAGSESEGDLSQGAGSTGCIKPPGASLSPTEPETSKPSLRPRIVFKPLSGAPRQAPSVPPNQETTAGATVVASARATLQIGAEPGVELFGGVISRPESEGLPWLHSELQAWLDASEGVRTAAGVPSDLVSPDHLLQQFHNCIQELGITSDVVFLPEPKQGGFQEEEDYNPKQKSQPNRKNGTPRGNKTAGDSKGKSSFPPIKPVEEALSNKRPAPGKKGNVLDRLAKKLRRK